MLIFGGVPFFKSIFGRCTLPETNMSPENRMLGIRVSFPFWGGGTRPIFRCKLVVSGSVHFLVYFRCMYWEKTVLWWVAETLRIRGFANTTPFRGREKKLPATAANFGAFDPLRDRRINGQPLNCQEMEVPMTSRMNHPGPKMRTWAAFGRRLVQVMGVFFSIGLWFYSFLWREWNSG